MEKISKAVRYPKDFHMAAIMRCWGDQLHKVAMETPMAHARVCNFTVFFFPLSLSVCVCVCVCVWSYF